MSCANVFLVWLDCMFCVNFQSDNYNDYVVIDLRFLFIRIGLQSVLHQTVYRGIFTVLMYKLSNQQCCLYLRVYYSSSILTACDLYINMKICYRIWSRFDCSCSIRKMFLSNLEMSTEFIWYCSTSGRGRF
jgi:hypothetical protein